MKIIDKDTGWDALKKHVDELTRGAHVLIGVQGTHAATVHRGSSQTVAGIATVHEFGLTITIKHGNKIRIPQRSFIRATIDQNKTSLLKRAGLLGQGILLQKFTTHDALALLGEYGVGLIKQRMADGIAPPNAPSTRARKGSSKPLIDTGQLRGSITYKVVGA